MFANVSDLLGVLVGDSSFDDNLLMLSYMSDLVGMVMSHGGLDASVDNMPVDYIKDPQVNVVRTDTVSLHDHFDLMLQLLGRHLLASQFVQGEDQSSRVLVALEILEHLVGNLGGLQDLGDFLDPPDVVDLLDDDLFLVLVLHFVDLVQHLLDVNHGLH